MEKEIYDTNNDLVGRKFGEWNVISITGTRALCKCSCGTMREINKYDLLRGKSKSCGHMTNVAIDLVGQRFGEWAVLEYLGKRRWLCKCSCGTIRDIDGGHLRGGYTKSCGCKSSRLIDLTGKIFGDLEVISYTGNRKWRCRCSCGKEIDVYGSSLRSGMSKSCGHNTTGFKDITGKVFGELTALEYKGNDTWLCRCTCGNVIETSGKRLRNGHTNSCGCKKQEHIMETMLLRYGEISSSKIGNPRDFEQILAIRNKDTIEKIINEYNDKPTIYELMTRLGLERSHVSKIIHKFGLDDKIKWRPSYSQYEEEIIEYLYNLNKDLIIVRNSRDILNSGKELDIYLPELNIAIEFNGKIWHCDKYKDKKYHQDKTLECYKCGIKLIHIFEHEWLVSSKKEKIKSILKCKVLGISNIVYARKTKIIEISQKEADIFLEEYHLQGSLNSGICLGCIYDNKLIGVMTFGKSRYDKKYEYELLRMAWHKDYGVVGGSEKLIKYFITKFSPKSIISYCDISKFDGHSYTKMGFKAHSITDPNYVWVEHYGSKVLSRYQTQKNKLIEMGYNKDSTESEIMRELGYLKIYDSGSLKLVREIIAE